VADQPLGLTVHSMPALDRADAASARTTAGRWKMLAVLLVCAAPVLASYFTYYVLRPTSIRAFGTLINPQRPLPDVAARLPDGTASNLRALKGQWLLVSVAPAGCDEACQRNLYWQRQLRETLGREKTRVDRVWLVSDNAPIPTTAQTTSTDFTVLRVPAAELSRWLEAEPGQQLADHLYVVDPMGNWMMRFPAALDLTGAGKAKRDLDRLLRASSSWDQPGR
jgi:hypothetical protein